MSNSECQQRIRSGQRCQRRAQLGTRSCWQHQKQSGGHSDLFNQWIKIVSPNTRLLKSLIINPVKYNYDLNTAMEKLNNHQLQSKVDNFAVILDDKIGGYQLVYRGNMISGSPQEVINQAIIALSQL